MPHFSKKYLLIAFFIFTLHCVTNGAEVDNFSARYESIEDSMSTYNDIINHAIDRAIISANSKRPEVACASHFFYKELFGQLGGLKRSQIEKIPGENDSIDTSSVPYRHSIFSKSGVTGRILNPMSHLLKRAGYGDWVVNINGVKVGSDKVGHFFHTGFEYFEIAFLQHQPGYSSQTLDFMKIILGKRRIKNLSGIEGALDLGHQQEINIWGLKLNGVYSYGDLAANYDGFRFWRDLFGGSQPLLRCDGPRIVRSRRFSFENYISHAWDESINCSLVNNHTIASRIDKNVKDLQERHGEVRRGCPVDPNKCGELVQKYAQARRVLSPICQNFGRKIQNRLKSSPPPRAN